MKRYVLKQEYGVDDENGKPLKSFSYQLYMQTHEVKEKHVLNMFHTFAAGFTRFMGEEVGTYDNSGIWPDIDMEFDKDIKFDDGTPLFSENDNQKRKRWFK